jgi:glycosyltransferase involved in cell wall biosynthesis
MTDAARPSQAAGPEAGTRGRIILDFTTSAMWSGPPVGIVRTENEFGRWALAHTDDITLAFYDPQVRTFRELAPDIARRLLVQDAAIDTLSFVSPARQGKRKTDLIPRFLQPAAMWLLQSRRKTLQVLERMRLGSGNARFTAFVDRVQRALMRDRHNALMIKPDGSRRDYLPVKRVVGPPIRLTARDTLVCAGATWTHDDIRVIAEEKRRTDFRLVVLCYDIIPLMFPEFYTDADVAAQRAYAEIAFPLANLVISISHATAEAVRAYCAERGLALGATAVCPLGVDLRTPEVPGKLPEGLEPGRYALLVSTIEPRKGHRMIYEVWLKLLAEGVPQRANFKLVFCGRVGWMVGDLMRELRNNPQNLVIITDADDATVWTLYRDCAFSLYPSRYEGFGLPVIESFSHGKAVLASSGGSVPEVVRDFSPCLDPGDAAAWERMLRTWIEQPAARIPYEERIRTSFRHPNWDEAAEQFFALVRGAPLRADGPR